MDSSTHGNITSTLPAQSFLTVNIGVVFIHVWYHVLKLDDTVLPIASYHNAELVLPKEKHSFAPCDLLHCCFSIKYSKAYRAYRISITRV